MSVFEQIGDRSARETASQYVQLTKEGLVRQRKMLKRKGNRKGKTGGKKSRSKPGSLENLLMSDSPMVRGKDKRRQTVIEQTSWSPGLKKWYGFQHSNSKWNSSLVLRNKHAKSEPVLAARRNLYRTSGISEQLNEHSGNLGSILRTVRPTFYSFGDYMMGKELHSDTEFGGSVTEYEDVEDDRQMPFKSRQHGLQFGSARHIKDLRQVGQTLLTKSVSDPGADGAQEEWAEWLHSHGMGRDDDK